MKRRLLLPAAAVSALAGLTFTVAACGGGGSSLPAPTVPAGALEVQTVPGLKLDKAEYTAKAGSVTIAYVNTDNQRHTLVVKDSAGVLVGTKLEVIKHNSISTGTFELAAGTYTIYCDVPGHGSMKATLTVS
jgi:hypothetical protein